MKNIIQGFVIGLAVILFGAVMFYLGFTAEKNRPRVHEVYIPEQHKEKAAKLYAEVYESAAKNYAGPMGHTDKPAVAAQQAVERLYGQ